jgi:hypothetical protein
LPCGPEERALRAAAVAAVDAVVAAAAAAAGSPAAGSGDGSGSGVPFSAFELSCYLLGQVQEDEGNAVGLRFGGEVLHPHTTLDTIAY